MRHLKRTNTAMTSNGERQIMEKVGKPEDMKPYMESENRRKSNRTLPPLSCMYSDILYE